MAIIACTREQAWLLRMPAHTVDVASVSMLHSGACHKRVVTTILDMHDNAIIGATAGDGSIVLVPVHTGVS